MERDRLILLWLPLVLACSDAPVGGTDAGAGTADGSGSADVGGGGNPSQAAAMFLKTIYEKG